jgi:hypothetical protein
MKRAGVMRRGSISACGWRRTILASALFQGRNALVSALQRNKSGPEMRLLHAGGSIALLSGINRSCVRKGGAVVVAIVVIVAATLFGYGVVWLLGREPLTTADLAIGVLTGLCGVALARTVMGGSFEGALIVACVAALALQTLRRRSGLELVE